jgi:YD repeat-containing protein
MTRPSPSYSVSGGSARNNSDILLALLTLVMLTGTASAQQRTLYDSSGRAAVRSVTNSDGTVTNYGADGRVMSRKTTSRKRATTIYDAHGHTVGRFTIPGKR